MKKALYGGGIHLSSTRAIKIITSVVKVLSIILRFMFKSAEKMYSVELEIFEGPLDLLLHLVDKNQLDITEIALASIIDEYQTYLHQLQYLKLEVESSFIIVFASLLEIKSKVLLPSPPQLEEDEPQDADEHELIKQLREYRLFKQYAENLETKLSRMNASYPRPFDDSLFDSQPVITSQISVEDLMDAYVCVMRKFAEKPEDNSIQLVKEQLSFPFILRMISKKIRNRKITGFQDLFDSPPEKIEFIIVFLALLEMAKRKRVSLVQNETGSGFSIINRLNKDKISTKELTEKIAG